MNARWAMIAVVGILVVDAYGGDWAHAGFLGTPRSGADWYALVPELGLMAWFEKNRWDSFLESGPVSTGFLGQAPFDPLKQGNDKMAEREIKNGRLAMLAVIGFFSQYAVRGVGPIESLKMHLDGPGATNIYTSAVGQEVLWAVLLLCITPMLIEANKLIGDDTGMRPIPFPDSPEQLGGGK